MTTQLSPEMIEALAAHRAAFVASNPNRCKAPRTAERLWREQLTTAWLNDYREQWGMLRTIRNQVGIQEAFDQFAAHRKANP